jgi:hypothetical protein
MSDDVEQQLRIRLMQADISNKVADTDYKRELTRWEPGKAMSVAFGAGVAVTTALFGALAWLFAHVHG